MNNNEMTQTQVNFVDAVKSFKAGSRNVVIAFENILSEYTKSFVTNQLDFIFKTLKDQPRLLKASKMIIKHELPVTISNKGLCVHSTKLGKREKETARANVVKFIALEMTSLLNHKTIKVVMEYTWEKKAGSFKSIVGKALENGVDKQTLIDMINSLDRIANVLVPNEEEEEEG